MPLIHGVIGDAVEPDLAVPPSLHARPFDAGVEVVCLARREMVDEARRAAGAARIDAHAGKIVRNPFLRIDHFPALIEVARAGGDIGMLVRHALPGARIAVLEGKTLGVGAVAQDHRIAAFRDRAGRHRRAAPGRHPSRSARPSRCASRRGSRCAADGSCGGPRSPPCGLRLERRHRRSSTPRCHCPAKAGHPVSPLSGNENQDDGEWPFADDDT